ncbi:YifB family Mg chelatase-like AAA ATPase [Aneurinibacillus uraniidurans]|uniref:YifB family Mg chelatase-like AAA ATPase n=1 Tax=Aneurinibacillus uraniidurans TaxID=2966586 RepID=UPI002349DC04|nr:YifB family Mg chelatase-like AAA ATPase [Aneurinibacillus sp. B1]WCN39077.1 YifB family Mg chelatase-like AAA ATPase [Aneurinibacillus sp. B1]
MFARVKSAVVYGVEGKCIEVEADIANGLPHFEISGLAASSVREARERVKAAIKNSGFTFPLQRITVNLAPADMRKAGSMLDCAIAVAILLASGQIEVRNRLADWLFVGELSLEGRLRSVPGLLPILLGARRQNEPGAVVPLDTGEEVDRVRLPLLRASTLQECAALFACPDEQITEISQLVDACTDRIEPRISSLCFSDVRGQRHVKRAMEVAAAGRHHLCMVGPPGTGKTMMAHRFPTILPLLSEEEELEVDTIYSAYGLLEERFKQQGQPPFRAPHTSITLTGMVGGGMGPKPGEMSLAHLGVLFLDEWAEFSRRVLESMRQPLEDGRIVLIRGDRKLTLPSRVVLLSAFNPCNCGHYQFEDQTNVCTCTESEVRRYRRKLSGPLLDRMDMHVEVPRVETEELDHITESSLDMRKRVEGARARQRARYEKMNCMYNADLFGTALRTHVQLSKEGSRFLAAIYRTTGLSNRSYDKILKISRSIADLDGCEEIHEAHIAEALQYRVLDRADWKR